MKILVTGQDGFIGKNLMTRLKMLKDVCISGFEKDDTLQTLEKNLLDADFVFHFAGANRPLNDCEFEEVNKGLTEQITDILSRNNKKTPVLITSSIHAEGENPYGISKRKAEEVLYRYHAETGSKIYIFRLPNVFGKWSRPDYNSVVATFCHNISRGIDISVADAGRELNLVYIDDVVNTFAAMLEKTHETDKFEYKIDTVYKTTLGELASLIRSFKEGRENLVLPDLSDGFTKALHTTYLSFLETDDFAYQLNQNKDERGSFTELFRTINSGQISVSYTAARGIVRGNHYHNTKNEKFCVVKGRAVIRFRRIDCTEIIEYNVSGEDIRVVDIPPGYTHNIENTGDEEMILIIWANEVFDPENPDTYYCMV